MTPATVPAIAPGGARPIDIALLASVFVVAACGLLYELAAGALASYVLGDSVLQFSTIIGTYLFAMGVGSWLSRYFERQLPAHFLRIELLVALIGGLLPATLFLANAYAPGAMAGTVAGVMPAPYRAAAPGSCRLAAGSANQTRLCLRWPAPTAHRPGSFPFHTGR